ncbi:MAG: hypothetical protein IPM47_11460 [Sphingobacteriales bacterium]|nr:MAG: hypothetical protein IPM47_11460 [Sphingobacteriales bacterium]
MQSENLYQVGYLTQAKSLKGELKAFFEAFFLDFLQKSKSKLNYLIVETKQGYLPYFIEKIQLQNDGNVLVKFEEINNLEAALPLQHSPVFYEKAKLEGFVSDELEDEEEGWDFLLGFTLIDASSNQTLAIIEDIYYLPAHELAQITYQNKEILIPLHEDLITEIDERAKSISINLPEGLVESQMSSEIEEDKDTD